MTASSPNITELLKKLDEHQQVYLKTFRELHEALAQSASASTLGPSNPTTTTTTTTSKRHRRSTQEPEADRPINQKPRTYHSSVLTGESDESDDDDELYVQSPLPSCKYDHEDLRYHLKHYAFDESGRGLLEKVVKGGRLMDPALFPEYEEGERWHNSHYSVFDVGMDGSPLSRREVVKEGTKSIDSAIWQAVQDLNADPEQQRKAVGRITIVREPSPIILGALHLTMNRYFDMDELFGLLYQESDSAAFFSNRAFSHDHRHQRSFAFKFDYFTIVGEEAEPMPWQRTDTPDKLASKSSEHIPISRCSSVVALSLVGDQVRKLRNAGRRAKQDHGYVFDPWAPWHVLNIQCYPDHKHSMDSHDSTKHYVNGPEAFLHTLLAEIKDAEKRFEDIYAKISKLVIPPADFMFDGKLRDKLLFEDEQFTYSRRYFWAFQTLGIMNNGIKSIIDAYEDTFTDEVWDGTHKSLWPMIDEDSPRNIYWRKRMASLKRDFERVIKGLEKLFEENDDRRKEIRTLRDQLFSGTSVLESRRSVELSEVTILQGHNIKLLTLVSIFFLPLTFVTSVFGMTNMPQEHDFVNFGVVMATVCIPFFLLIGTLNTTFGMTLFRSKTHQLFSWIWGKSHKENTEDEHINSQGPLNIRKRTLSESHAIRIRMEQMNPIRSSSLSFSRTHKKDIGSPTIASPSSPMSPIQIQQPRIIEAVAIHEPPLAKLDKDKRVNDVVMSPAVSTEKALSGRPELERSRSWWGRWSWRKSRDGAHGRELGV